MSSETASPEILTFETPSAAAEACGAATFSLLETAVRERGVARLAVSGGNTPKIMFEWMARQAFDWAKIQIFWVDERCVPVDDKQSNYRMTRESLLDAVHLDPSQIHRIRTELLPDEAALAYAAEIAQAFGLRHGELPQFDVLQRGMGPDGHTASLFPGEPLIGNQSGIAAAVWVEKFHQHRVTLLPGVLEGAHHTLCLVTGADKADGLHEVLRGPRDPFRMPSQLSSPAMSWYIDRQAGSRLQA